MNYSFEFFPAKSSDALTTLLSVAEYYTLTVNNIKFFSVTYGAGGSTRDTTLRSIKELLKFDVPIYAHLTTVGHTWEDIRRLLDSYVELGVKGIVALRGDIPSGTGISEMYPAIDLVRFIRDNYPELDIKVAGYPEKHPDSKYLDECIKNSINKLDAGASSIITQFCLNTEAVSAFTEEVVRKSIEHSYNNVTPGLLPIYNFDQFKKFAHKCEAEVPKWIEESFKYQNAHGNSEEFAKELFLTQLFNLSRDFSHVHIYTLNRMLFGINLSILEI